MKILLLEDNESFVQLIRRSYGHEHLFIFDRLDDAHEWLKTNKADLLLIDLGLPDSQGIDTLKALSHINTPKVVMTASIDVARQAARNGASDFIPKNGDTYELLARVGFNIEKHRPKVRNLFAPEVFEQIKACLTIPRHELTLAG